MSGRITFDGNAFRAEPWTGPAPDDFADVFQVYASDASNAPALLGAYTLQDGAILFTPRFRPAPSITLRAVFHAREGATVKASFAGEANESAEPARVAAIYPSTDVWPTNILKFYIHFSAPMTIGDAWKRVRFRDEAGDVVEGAFVEIDQELWDREGKRLTVLFDPGRIKRGLKDNAVEGTPFITGKAYTLEIDAGWRDAQGRPLIEGVRKTIRAGGEARLPVDPTRWAIEAPRGPDEALVLCFPRPLDHALAQRAISVWRGEERIVGQTVMQEQEKRLVFAPAARWEKGRYEIAVDGVIEDLAGNKLGRLFDVDTGDPTQAREGLSEMRLPFSLAFAKT